MNFLKLKIRNISILQLLTISLVYVFVMVSCSGGDTEKEQADNEELLFDGQQNASDITNEELTLFVEAALKIEEINKNAQNKMEGILDNEGMKVERFNELMMAQQNQETNGDATSEEKESFSKISDELNLLQMEVETEAIEIIENIGLSIERYQEINMALQQDIELYERFLEKIEEGN